MCALFAPVAMLNAHVMQAHIKYPLTIDLYYIGAVALLYFICLEAVEMRNLRCLDALELEV